MPRGSSWHAACTRRQCKACSTLAHTHISASSSGSSSGGCSCCSCPSPSLPPSCNWGAVAACCHHTAPSSNTSPCFATRPLPPSSKSGGRGEARVASASACACACPAAVAAAAGCACAAALGPHSRSPTSGATARLRRACPCPSRSPGPGPCGRATAPATRRWRRRSAAAPSGCSRAACPGGVGPYRPPCASPSDPPADDGLSSKGLVEVRHGGAAVPAVLLWQQLAEVL